VVQTSINVTNHGKIIRVIRLIFEHRIEASKIMTGEILPHNVSDLAVHSISEIFDLDSIDRCPHLFQHVSEFAVSRCFFEQLKFMVFFIVALFGKPHADLARVSRRNSEVAIKDLVDSPP
jgi:hypothetical protein